MKKPKPPKCPVCKRPAVKVGTKLWKCPVGCGLLDGSPQEGGTHHNDPSKRAIREEEYGPGR